MEAAKEARRSDVEAEREVRDVKVVEREEREERRA